MEKLIITGWFWKDYACAAALALRHYKKADVIGMSARRLPEFLNELTPKQYREIAILGVNLSGDPELLDQALTKLRAAKVKVRWISSIEFPEEITEKIKSKLDHFVSTESDGVTGAVSRCFDQPVGDLANLVAEKNLSRDLQNQCNLLEAAMYFYRNYQDENAYGLAITHLANNESEKSWSQAERHMVTEYLRCGDRELVGKSAIMMKLQEQIAKVAAHERARVFIHGESGTGKEAIALFIHNKSPRRQEPFIAFNCASVTPNLLEDRFFGHEKGAFTGAGEQRQGLFELADGGTLFLDEIGEMPLEAQGVMLRVLEGGRFMRVGGKTEISVNVRLITATNRDLAAMVREGKFREDLFHRLNVVQIHAPALREHPEDIAHIANKYWLKTYHRRLKPEQIEALKDYDYPGNVRELLNILERAEVLEENDFGKLVREQKATMTGLRSATPIENVPDDLESAIRRHIELVYDKYEHNLSRTADALQVARNTVRKYLEEK